MSVPKKNDPTLRERIQKHLAILKIPLTSPQVDEILAAADKSQLSHLELLERFLSVIRASGERRLPNRVRYYSRFELLIIDEFGFEKLERLEYPESPSLLYKVIDRRNRRGSTALVTNVDFQDWTSYLGDPPLAMALLDRVVDGAIVQKFKGKSYRDYRSQHKNAAPNGTPGKPTNGHPALQNAPSRRSS